MEQKSELCGCKMLSLLHVVVLNWMQFLSTYALKSKIQYFINIIHISIMHGLKQSSFYLYIYL